MMKELLCTIAGICIMNAAKTTNLNKETEKLDINEKVTEQTNKAVQPSQWILPTQVKTSNVFKCKNDLDWPNNIKCPSHHPYIWSKMHTIKIVPSRTSKYGDTQCNVDIICSNIYDVDAPGNIFQ